MTGCMTNDVVIASPASVLDEIFGEISVVFYTVAADSDFALTYMSRNAGRALGVRPESCVGSALFWRERIHADDIEPVLQVLAGLSVAGRATHEFRFRDDQDNYLWVSNEVAFKRDANGIDAHLAGCLRDISAEKIREMEFARNLKEQSAREHFYLSVLDSVPQRLFWKDRNSVFRGCNLSGARALKLAGTSEIVGKTDYDFYPDHEEADYLRINDEQVMYLGQASYHNEIPAKDGDTWLDVTKVPLRDENGEIYGLLVSYEDVSALKKSERALRKFKRAVEQSSNSIFIADVVGNIEYANPSFLNTYGYKEHEVIGKSLHSLKSEFISQDICSRMWKTVMGGNSWNGELANRSREGETCWQAVSFSPIFDEGGEIMNLLAIANNITERKRMEEALAENEAHLREITSAVGEGIYVSDMNGIITFANPAAGRLFDLSEQELLGQDVRNIFNCPAPRKPDALGAMSRCLLEEVKKTCEVIRSENVFFMREDGSRFPVSVIASPILRGGNYAGAVVAFHDITEQKLIQGLLNDTLQELRTVLDNAQIGVAYMRENAFFWINKHMEYMFGYVAGDLIGKPMETIYTDDETGQDDPSGEVYGLLAQGGVYEDECLMRRCTGEVFWCHQRGVAIDPDDPGKGSIWIMLDIDRLKRTENSLKALNETLAQRVDEEIQKTLERERLLIQQGRNAAMGEMIGNIAHQWRQPLSTLGLVVQNIQADYQEGILTEAALGKYVNTAGLAIQRMSCTIDDFRDFFRQSRAKERFPIYQATQEAMQLLDAMLKNNGIAISLSGDKDLKVFGRQNEFSQVILNFLVNAKDALAERKVPQGHVAIELVGRDGLGVVTIRDNAGGIPDSNLEKIFDPYFTTKQSGTGIGLHMNKTIIEKHMHGSIIVHNVRDGAEFVLSVPLDKGDEPSKGGEAKND